MCHSLYNQSCESWQEHEYDRCKEHQRACGFGVQQKKRQSTQDDHAKLNTDECCDFFFLFHNNCPPIACRMSFRLTEHGYYKPSTRCKVNNGNWHSKDFVDMPKSKRYNCTP